MSDHACDKALIIGEHGRQLGELFGRVGRVEESRAKVEQLLRGNGSPGLIAAVDNHDSRIDGLERRAITEEALKRMLRGQARLIGAGLGLTATVLGLLQIIIPAVRASLGMP